MPYVEKLKMIKEEKKISNAEISKVGNIPLATVIRVFNGQTLNPTFETITGIAIGMGVSLDELAGLKQPDAPPIPSPIEDTLNAYIELLKEKDDKIKERDEKIKERDERIAELKAERDSERKDKHRVTCVLVCFVAIVLIILAIDIWKAHS